MVKATESDGLQVSGGGGGQEHSLAGWATRTATGDSAAGMNSAGQAYLDCAAYFRTLVC